MLIFFFFFYIMSEGHKVDSDFSSDAKKKKKGLNEYILASWMLHEEQCL